MPAAWVCNCGMGGSDPSDPGGGRRITRIPAGKLAVAEVGVPGWMTLTVLLCGLFCGRDVVDRTLGEAREVDEVLEALE